MNAALVVDSLNLHNWFIWLGFQHTVVPATAGMGEIHWASERIRPKLRCSFNVFDIAIDQYGA